MPRVAICVWTMSAFLVLLTGLQTIGCADGPSINVGSYSIIDWHILPGTKRSLDVRLIKAVSEDTLRAIAFELKSQDSRNYARTFITYYLPGMTVGAGAWATSHFTPDLKVKILGLTIEETRKFTAQSAPANREIVGRWLDNTIAGARVTIFSERGNLFFEQHFKDGSILKLELVERQSPLGRRFNMANSNSSGDHWVINAEGSLQFRDNEGLIRTARKIE